MTPAGESTFGSLAARAAARSDVGRVRDENEDSYGVFPELGLYVVADGIGGHVAGREASGLTVATIRSSVAEVDDEDLTPVIDAFGHASVEGRRLVMAVQRANDEVRRAGQTPGFAGMGSTVAAVYLDRERALAVISHVGDSRVYRVRGATAEQLTDDHTVVGQLVREGKLDPREARRDPNRHVITKAIGSSDVLAPSMRLEPVEAGDCYVLCSDGVHDVVTDEEIGAIVVAQGDRLDQACESLIALANERGGRDNSTVVIVTFLPLDEA